MHEMRKGSHTAGLRHAFVNMRTSHSYARPEDEEGFLERLSCNEEVQTWSVALPFSLVLALTASGRASVAPSLTKEYSFHKVSWLSSSMFTSTSSSCSAQQAEHSMPLSSAIQDGECVVLLWILVSWYPCEGLIGGHKSTHAVAMKLRGQDRQDDIQWLHCRSN